MIKRRALRTRCGGRPRSAARAARPPKPTPWACSRFRLIKTLVLDEADEMLSKGFKEQIYDVYRYLPPETQVGGGGGTACGRAGVGHTGSVHA